MNWLMPLGHLNWFFAGENDDSEIQEKNLYHNLNVEENITSLSNKKQNTSCPSFLKTFPNILDNITAFLKQQGYAAWCRRRTETDYTSGAQIPWHLFQTVSGLQQCGISLSTIQQFFSPTNAGNNMSWR